ncbi:leucine-rich repeat domain-containing protein [Flavivirga algicola]|uniref:Leucine-rich repeat domain-containing protein n=1 Tax=Flavivirga algicola TaxID=2729136 RepID=A0ABX1RTV6_9FLAO|nr:leucine-rich repeat domain-containing protein [Flavivirga algicola]NMH86601.1 leucine-rich repeat domain-containing protein [Flavivirga algicola]
MSDNEIKVQKDSQNRESEAWEKLIKLIETAKVDERQEFNPAKELGFEIWKDIRSLPKEIGELNQVKHLMLYGSNLTRFPQEIGEMESLEKFTPYTSYGLRWFPYEITKCKKLKDSTVSTRALFGNFKNKKPFPDLTDNPVNYFDNNKCSLCGKRETKSRFEQYWLSIRVATDVLPLLAIVCSDSCFSKLPKPEEGYYPKPHKGGKLKKE